jgi:hypothetical protein
MEYLNLMGTHIYTHLNREIRIHWKNRQIENRNIISAKDVFGTKNKTLFHSHENFSRVE